MSAQGQAGSSAQQRAPIDLTGYWVSVVTENWRWRMVTPARGDYQSVPLNELAYQTALKWDPAKDEAAGLQCRAFGAAGLMHLPERLHISWQDGNTLVVQIDAGMQRRVFHFGGWQAPRDEAPSWQGDSLARWEITGPAGASKQRFGSLRVETTHLLAGYLRTNGLPYSEQTRLIEYWDLMHQRGSGGLQGGTPWIILTSIVHDPVYLQNDWITALNFKREPDGSKWNPQPCTARW